MKNRFGWWAMIAIMVLVGVRAVLAARSVSGGNPNAAPAAARFQTDPLLTAVDRQDSLLEAASLSARDPFRAWTPPNAVLGTRPTTTAPAPPPVVPPRVAVFMQDGSSVIIQIEVDGDTSPRMSMGGTFRGWTITGSSGNSITLMKDGRSFSVPRP